MNRKKIIALTIAASLSAFTEIALAEYDEMLICPLKEITLENTEGVLLTSYKSVEDTVDLREVVSIKDVELKKEIMKALNTTDETITVGDMYKLKTLSIYRSLITSLEGLEYARNLESIEINYSEITDISPLKYLKGLKEISIMEGHIVVGMVPEFEDKIIIDETRIDITGERLRPLEIRVGNIEGVNSLNLEEVVLEDGIIAIDKEKIGNGVNSITVQYEGLNGRFQTESKYMFIK